MDHNVQHLAAWPKNWPLVAHAEGETTAAIILHAHLAGTWHIILSPAI